MIFEKLKGVLATARGAVQNLQSTEHAMRDEHTRLQQERARVLAAPPPTRELLEHVLTEVDRLGQAWLQRQGPGSGAALVSSLVGIEGLAGRLETNGLPACDFAMLCWLLPDAVKAGLYRLIEEARLSEGLPLAERPARLAELDRQLVKLEREHSELSDLASASGIAIPLLPEIRGQRARDAAKREAWEKDAQINRRHYERFPSERPPEPHGHA